MLWYGAVFSHVILLGFVLFHLVFLSLHACACSCVVALLWKHDTGIVPHGELQEHDVCALSCAWCFSFAFCEILLCAYLHGGIYRDMYHSCASERLHVVIQWTSFEQSVDITLQALSIISDLLSLFGFTGETLGGTSYFCKSITSYCVGWGGVCGLVLWIGCVWMSWGRVAVWIGGIWDKG